MAIRKADFILSVASKDGITRLGCRARGAALSATLRAAAEPQFSRDSTSEQTGAAGNRPAAPNERRDRASFMHAGLMNPWLALHFNQGRGRIVSHAQTGSNSTISGGAYQ